MAAVGMPTPHADHPQSAVALALDMVETVREVGKEINIRIGLHSGPAVAGVIGNDKVFYDV